MRELAATVRKNADRVITHSDEVKVCYDGDCSPWLDHDGESNPPSFVPALLCRRLTTSQRTTPRTATRPARPSVLPSEGDARCLLTQ